MMSSLAGDVATRGLEVAAVVVALTIFRKYVPAATVNLKGEELGSEELEERFMPLRERVIVAMIAIGIAFLLCTWFALSTLNLLLARLDGPADFLFLPQGAIWWFFPGFGAVTLCWELTLQIWALWGDRKTVNLFSDWTNQSPTFWGANFGMDSRKILQWMAVIVVLPIFVFTVLALNMHAIVNHATIRDCGYAFKPCTTYSLANASRLTEIEGFRTTDGKLSHQAGIVVDFKDGRRWSSADWGDFKNPVDPAFADFLKGATGLPLGSAVTAEDIKRLPAEPSTR